MELKEEEEAVVIIGEKEFIVQGMGLEEEEEEGLV
jgi:hypothetical protein